MKVILHVGPPKSGTSSIQKALNAAADDLGTRNIRYYRAPQLNEWSLMYLYSSREQTELPPYLKSFFGDRAEALAWSRACWDRFEETVDGLACDYVVLSSEHFANIRQKDGFLHRLTQRFDEIQLLAYARDPVSLYASTIDQAIRGGARWGDLTLPHDYAYNPVKSLRGYEPLLPAGHLSIRNFSREVLRNGDVVTDFFAELSRITNRDLPVPQTKTKDNSSLCGAATSWLLMVNQTIERSRQPTEYHRELMQARRKLIKRLRDHETLAGLPKLSFQNTPVERVIRHNSRQPVTWLNRHYLAGQPLKTSEPSHLVLPSPAAATAALRDHLMQYLDADAVAALGAALLTGPRPVRPASLSA